MPLVFPNNQLYSGADLPVRGRPTRAGWIDAVEERVQGDPRGPGGPPHHSYRIVVALSIVLLSGCTRQPAVEAKQDSGPISIKTTGVTVKQLQRDVESV